MSGVTSVSWTVERFRGKCIEPATHTICARTDSLSPFVTAVDLRPACSNGYDDDGDGLIDFDGGASANGGVPLGPPDPGCLNAASTTESPACQDGIDNDGDGGIDFDGGASATHGVVHGARDVDCTTPYQDHEYFVLHVSGCGLGAELSITVRC